MNTVQAHKEQMVHAVDQYARTYQADENRINQLKAKIMDSVGTQYSAANGSMHTFDADGAAFFARQLEQIENRIYKKKYPELKARQVIPVDNQGGEWTDKLTYRVFDVQGEAKIINSYNSTDIPLVNLSAKEVSVQARYIASAFSYTVMEIARAQHAGVPLGNELAIAARDFIERKIDSIAWHGDADHGLNGLLDNGNIPKSNAANGANGTPEWSTKTPGEILFDILDAFADVQELTKEVETPDNLALPTAQYNLLLQPRSTTSDTSIIKWIVENVPFLNGRMENITSVPKLKGAGTNDVDMMIVYRKDPEKLVLSIPMDILIEPPEKRDLSFKSIMRSSTAGTIVRYPLSLKFIEKI